MRLPLFGFADEITVVAPGINAKMNELQAAFGSLQLKYVDDCIAKRKSITDLYRLKLANIPGIRVHNDMEGIHHTYSYFPILIDEEKYGSQRDCVYEKLKKHNFFGRRYFYPLISQFPTYRELPSARTDNLPVATMISRQVLCLPIFPDLDFESVHEICEVLINQ
jgi:dTDP-4-amino-4,6-dideoxygalactose transaminase